MEYGYIIIYGIALIITLGMYTYKKKNELIPFIFIFLSITLLEIMENILFVFSNNFIVKFILMSIVFTLILISTFFSFKKLVLENSYKEFGTKICIICLLLVLYFKYINNLNLDVILKLIFMAFSMLIITGILIKIKKVN